MNPQNPLAQLRDIQPPIAPGFWPPTLSFYLILGAVILCIILAYVYYRIQRGPAWYRAAQKLIRSECKALSENPTAEQLAKLNQAIKRVAYKISSREKVASLQGKQWCHWLDTTAQSNGFTHGAGQVLADIYNPKLSLNQGQIKELSKVLHHWLLQIKPNRQKKRQDPQTPEPQKPDSETTQLLKNESPEPAENEYQEASRKIKHDLQVLVKRFKGQHD